MTQNKDKGKRNFSRWLDYGSINAESQWDSCPTCQGTGRIPRGQEAQLVAVIPCTDKRLKPRHTKLYVCLSMIVCLLICSLILFFLFPRSVNISPVTFQSSVVYFTSSAVDMILTNKLNLSNTNFVPLQIQDMDLQVLIYDTVVGKTKVSNMTTVPPRSQKSLTVVTNIHITNSDLIMTIKVSYLSHDEQLSVDTFEYVDCGTNTTVPHTFLQLH